MLTEFDTFNSNRIVYVQLIPTLLLSTFERKYKIKDWRDTWIRRVRERGWERNKRNKIKMRRLKDRGRERNKKNK